MSQASADHHFDLGAHRRPISTTSPEAQRWFDLGLNWCFGFNQEEGVKCFLAALEHDPGCVMAHWGVAYGSGPFYNLAWREFGDQEAAAAISFARVHLSKAAAGTAAPVERDLVEALAGRFLAPHPVSADEYGRWDDEYAARMRRVHQRYPEDHDVMALFAEALITRTPRRLWNLRTGDPAQGSDVVEAVSVIERSIAMADAAGQTPHPALVHLHIHALEMSNTPERAMRSADLLATLCPDAGHMNHMPAHIYALCGAWEKARAASDRAIRADDLYAQYAGSMNFYVTARCHDIHLLMFTCMFLGQYGRALGAAEKIRAILTEDILRVQGRPKLAMTTEGYYGMKMHVLVRFGRWRETIAEPLPGDPALYLVSTAMQHYARCVAYASLRHIADAEQSRGAFYASLARIPASRRFLSNPAHATLAVGAAMLEGELAYHKGDHATAFEHLREAVRRDDNLGYTEPWAWMHPPRHALGALLLEQGHRAEAEQVYRDDLGMSGRIQRCTQHPDNVWALHGLVECLERRDEQAELPRLRQMLATAQGRADLPIASSCLCRSAVERLGRPAAVTSPGSASTQAAPQESSCSKPPRV